MGLYRDYFKDPFRHSQLTKGATLVDACRGANTSVTIVGHLPDPKP